MSYKNLISSLILTENYYDALYYLEERLYDKYNDINKTSIINSISDSRIADAYYKLSKLINKKETQKKIYENWLNSMTEEEESVWSRALKYDSKRDDINPGTFDDLKLYYYQEDILFSKVSDRALTENEIKMIYKDKKNLDLIDIKYEDTHLDIDFHNLLSIKGWRFYVVENAEDVGCTYYDEKKVVIDKKHFDNDIVLLHEMIHIYNHLLKDIGLDDYVSLRLFGDINPYFENLYEIIDLDNHILNKEHSLLFLLKSLQLDLSTGFKFGTFYAYDRADLFENLKLRDSIPSVVG